MKILSQLVFAIITALASSLSGDVLQDTCDTGVQDTIIVGSVQVPGPLWPDSIGVPIYIWADEPIAAFSWGLHPLDNRIRVSSFSKVGSVFPTQMFIPTLVDTVNNRIGFGWADFMGTDPIYSPQGLVGTLYFKLEPNISISEELGIDSVSILPAYSCGLTSATEQGGTCRLRYVEFARGDSASLVFGSADSTVELHHSFDEGSGGIVYDRSGHGKDGVSSGQPSWILGVLGNAMHFDGTDDYVAFPELYSFPFQGPLTASMWIRREPNPLADRQNMMRYGGAGEWDMFVMRDTIWCNLNFYGTAPPWPGISLQLVDGMRWNHLAMVWNRASNTLIVYLNGDSVTQVSVPDHNLYCYSTAIPRALGAVALPWGSENHFQGDIDEFKVWLRPLTSAEILTEYLRVNYVACGDADASRQVNIADVVFLVNYIFAGGAAPPQLDSADVTCGGSIDITDVVYLVNYFFATGPVPCVGCP